MTYVAKPQPGLPELKMRKGAKSFVEFSCFIVPAIVGFALITGIYSSLGGLLGVFFVLQFANNLDRNSSN